MADARPCSKDVEHRVETGETTDAMPAGPVFSWSPKRTPRRSFMAASLHQRKVFIGGCGSGIARVAAALKPIYTAPTIEAAHAELMAFADSDLGRRYPAAVQTWEHAWDRFIPFLAFPPEVRKIIYTTNAIESLNYQLRKIIKNRGHFPHRRRRDQAALAGHPRHRRQTSPSTRQRERPTTQPTPSTRQTRGRRHRPRLASSSRRPHPALPRTPQQLPNLTPKFLDRLTQTT